MDYLEATVPTGFPETRAESLMEGATDLGTKIIKCRTCFGGSDPKPPPEEPVPTELENQMCTPVGDGLEVPHDIGDF